MILRLIKVGFLDCIFKRRNPARTGYKEYESREAIFGSFLAVRQEGTFTFIKQISEFSYEIIPFIALVLLF